MKTIVLSPRGGKHRGKYVAIVDDEDYERLVAMGRWSVFISGSGASKYAIIHNAEGVRILMHRLLVSSSQQVDHVNGDGLDNRRANLRACSAAQNTYNKRRCGAKSGFKGVYQGRKGRPYAMISIGGRQRRIGSFDTPEEAARAYDAAALAAFGEFARPNFPKGAR